ncbi:class I SAM-dependent methyltransferase [Mangrovibrevibacter kandeliae]|uniref:class I SAM-dependent methyltransferase n=1 Tax=Mangrovibrevibacter kandeliae TaxID=2968473 RepID=UPI0021184D6F|nr:class I SAM-dependent methyltransferase [Aurantimonas sp. CSK15Z-1]MCQ8782821.1 class I SAM-dependent methyltransferase [Aurantimonas sp. CSK15Z-1]
MSISTSGTEGHLDYYVARGISPVHYQMHNLSEHFDRRDSLYRSLGLPPAAFRNVDVLEVAAGSGQNSLYLAAQRPASLTLVEPNPTGRRDIEAAYAALSEVPHTRPVIVPQTLQDFEPGRQYDIVICENWLGARADELELLDKLVGLVAPGGVLVITYVPLSGFFPNVMRKLLALRIMPETDDFERTTETMVEVFGPHLATMPAMTRSHRDWVHDCVMNPHYLNVALPLETVLATVGERMEALASFPRFAADWRWFKSLVGEHRAFDAVLSEAAAANVASFIDHRRLLPPRQDATTQALEAAFAELHRRSLAWQRAREAASTDERDALGRAIGDDLARIAALLSEIDAALAAAVTELEAVWRMPEPSAEAVRDMAAFGPLFGRETVYLSLTRR